MLTNGTSGDINNIDVSPTRLLAQNAERARLVASTVAAAAIQATMVRRRRDELVLDSSSEFILVERCQITGDDVALANDILSQPEETNYDPVAGFSFVVGQPIPGYQARAYASGVLEMAKMPEEGQTEIQIIRIGDLALVALPGEIFVEFGLAIKAESPFGRVAVLSMANDHIGYCPTRKAFSEGSYETWRIRSSWTAPGTGERLVEESLRGLNALHAASLSSSVGHEIGGGRTTR
jgi:hypothetical protein